MRSFFYTVRFYCPTRLCVCSHGEVSSWLDWLPPTAMNTLTMIYGHLIRRINSLHQQVCVLWGLCTYASSKSRNTDRWAEHVSSNLVLLNHSGFTLKTTDRLFQQNNMPHCSLCNRVLAVTSSPSSVFCRGSLRYAHLQIFKHPKINEWHAANYACRLEANCCNGEWTPWTVGLVTGCTNAQLIKNYLLIWLFIN